MMNQKNRKVSAVLAVAMLLTTSQSTIKAQQPEAQTIGASHGQIAGAVAGIAGAGVLIGVLAYVAVNHNHSVTGCVRSVSDSVELTTESDKQTYTLVGEVSAIKPGHRVRLAGKKSKGSGNRQFLVTKLSKDFGPCEVAGISR